MGRGGEGGWKECRWGLDQKRTHVDKGGGLMKIWWFWVYLLFQWSFHTILTLENTDKWCQSGERVPKIPIFAVTSFLNGPLRKNTSCTKSEAFHGRACILIKEVRTHMDYMENLFSFQHCICFILTSEFWISIHNNKNHHILDNFR